MKLSMWIIANLLESFEPEIHIQKDSPRVLRSARMAHATDCVYVRQDGHDCLYCWGSDTIRMHELSAREGFELLQSLFDFMYDWLAQLSDAIEQQNYQLAIDLCHTVFRNPATLATDNHQCLALSSQYGPEDVDAEWLHLKTYGCPSIESARHITEAQISHHFSDHIIRYRFEQNTPLCSSLSASILHNGMPVGYLTVLEKEHALNYGHMQLMSMIAELLSLSLSKNSEEKEDATPFLMLLNGSPIPRSMAQTFYSQKKWSPDHTYRVILFDFQQIDDSLRQRQNYFLVTSLSAVFPEDLCGMYNGKFVMLANDSLLPQAQRQIRLEHQLRSSEVKIVTSLPFPGIRFIPELYNQVTFALEYGGGLQPNLKFLDFYHFAVDYLIRSPYRPESCLAACHPDIYALYRYDEVLYRTLWVYLVQDRSVTRTVAHLFIHKNTLLHRLRRIEEFLTHSLADSYSREYMRLSFALLERHAALASPPETPFPVTAPQQN